ncbi:GNAT family N-acetyltransferase [Marinobacter salarius]|nr:GNAT family N-acetyltransferase [Marinobacter salarius]
MSIFQTDAWQTAWWREWGQTRGFQLLEQGGSGVSGVYIDKYLLKGLIPLRCLQFVGTNYRRISTPRTEYNSFVCSKETFDQGAGRLERLLSSCGWSEAVFRDVIKQSPEALHLQNLAHKAGWSYRVVDSDVAYSIETTGSFDNYLSALGPNTRLRLFNRRKVLETCGELSFANAWPGSPDDFFNALNAFHVERWGQPCFSARSLRFHKDFLTHVVEEGGVPDLSIMRCDGTAVSVLYNVHYRGRCYNLQSGYQEDFHPKLALGTLHLGYSIEEAFENAGIADFDLLAGSGKNEDYKARLATHAEPLISFMLVRSRIFRYLYRIKSGN